MDFTHILSEIVGEEVSLQLSRKDYLQAIVSGILVMSDDETIYSVGKGGVNYYMCFEPSNVKSVSFRKNNIVIFLDNGTCIFCSGTSSVIFSETTTLGS